MHGRIFAMIDVIGLSAASFRDTFSVTSKPLYSMDATVEPQLATTTIPFSGFGCMLAGCTKKDTTTPLVHKPAIGNLPFRLALGTLQNEGCRLGLHIHAGGFFILPTAVNIHQASVLPPRRNFPELESHRCHCASACADCCDHTLLDTHSVSQHGSHYWYAMVTLYGHLDSYAWNVISVPESLESILLDPGRQEKVLITLIRTHPQYKMNKISETRNCGLWLKQKYHLHISGGA